MVAVCVIQGIKMLPVMKLLGKRVKSFKPRFKVANPEIVTSIFINFPHAVIGQAVGVFIVMAVVFKDLTIITVQSPIIGTDP